MLDIRSLFIASLALCVACGDDDSSTDTTDDAPGDAGPMADGSTPSGDGGGSEGVVTFPECPTDLWADIGDYELVGELSDCPASNPVAASLFQLDGVTIDNNGASMTPCIEARCDDAYVYVATNKLPHYDYVQTTPNTLAENVSIARLPLTPTPVGTVAGATDAMTANGCVDGYEQYLTNPGNATANEPSGLCTNAGALFLTEALSGGTANYQAIPCLGGFGFVLSGVSTNGPNEAGFPDPWGDPAATSPNSIDEGVGALDYCGAHVGADMHHHYVPTACFERDAVGRPAQSYVAAAEAWDKEAMLVGDCTEESPIVGWSVDGYPIKGPCVCVSRAGDGSCAEVRRAMSSWTYEGLGVWESESALDPGDTFAVEGMACSSDADCAGEDFTCNWVLTGDDSTASQRCMLIDYAWCTHRYADRSASARSDVVFLDRCNGTQGADGYAYHTTASFPYIQGCYHGEAPDQAGNGGAPGGGMGPGGDGMMPGGGGMDPPTCGPGETMCCGDGVCDGPETAENCPADCV